MNIFNINNKEYLLSIEPKYRFIPIITLSIIFILFLLLFYFKTYDIYSSKAYIECEQKCSVILSVDPKDINKVNKIDFIKLNNVQIIVDKVIIDKIQVDEVNKINYQNVIFEVNQLDNDIVNTFQDVKIYSNSENIFEKIKKIII